MRHHRAAEREGSAPSPDLVRRSREAIRVGRPLQGALSPRADVGEIAALATKLAEAGETLQALDATVRPRVDAGSVDSAISKGERRIAILREIGELASAANLSPGRSVGEGTPPRAELHLGTQECQHARERDDDDLHPIEQT